MLPGHAPLCRLMKRMGAGHQAVSRNLKVQRMRRLLFFKGGLSVDVLCWTWLGLGRRTTSSVAKRLFRLAGCWPTAEDTERALTPRKVKKLKPMATGSWRWYFMLMCKSTLLGIARPLFNTQLAVIDRSICCEPTKKGCFQGLT